MKKIIMLLFLLVLILNGSLVAQENNHAKEGEKHYLKAKEYVRTKDVDKVIFHLEKAIDLGYSDEHVYAMIGGMYQEKGSNEKAKKYYTLALEMFEKKLKAYKINKDLPILKTYKSKGYDAIKETEFVINDLKTKLKNLETLKTK